MIEVRNGQWQAKSTTRPIQPTTFHLTTVASAIETGVQGVVSFQLSFLLFSPPSLFHPYLFQTQPAILAPLLFHSEQLRAACPIFERTYPETRFFGVTNLLAFPARRSPPHSTGPCSVGSTLQTGKACLEGPKPASRHSAASAGLNPPSTGVNKAI